MKVENSMLNRNKFYTVGWYPWGILRASLKGALYKMGAHEGYTGGIVFRSLVDLKRYISQCGPKSRVSFQILELRCKNKDVYTANDGNDYLKRDAPMRWRKHLKRNLSK